LQLYAFLIHLRLLRLLYGRLYSKLQLLFGIFSAVNSYFTVSYETFTTTVHSSFTILQLQALQLSSQSNYDNSVSSIHYHRRSEAKKAVMNEVCRYQSTGLLKNLWTNLYDFFAGIGAVRATDMI